MSVKRYEKVVCDEHANGVLQAIDRAAAGKGE